MKKIINSIISAMMAMTLVFAPVVEVQAQGRHNTENRDRGNNANRGNRSGRNHSDRKPGNQTKPAQRPGNNTRPNNRPGNQNKPNNRPGNQNKPNNRPENRPNNRPGNQDRPNHKPGNRPGNSFDRPGNHKPNHRPDNRPNHRPGNFPGNSFDRPGRPVSSHRPAPRPHHPPKPHRHHHGYRHPVPFFNGYHRPTPPPRWHYRGGGPSFGTILGVTLGTALAASLTSLINNGYTVSSYGNDVIYMSNVNEMNYLWPDAALYYNNGRLAGSQFTYPTPYYDMSRYSHLYNSFINMYGYPVNQSNTGGLLTSTWFGPSGRYITLSYNSQYGNYYTTLSFGY